MVSKCQLLVTVGVPESKGKHIQADELMTK
jgi:hypothetical protein